ncbi:protein of unknown function [Moritella yayanosii]|uniref:Uncharacterized protein n=1 Tax=Moritella yayanosii TaxID=69539 RepID=A0A330LMF4_9GAMM|nr:protein of unknown function [Moritella yayanosii]
MAWKLANIQYIITSTLLIAIYITSNNIYLGVRNVGSTDCILGFSFP